MNLSQAVDQAVSDFDGIETAIEANGVEVPAGTPTADYDERINEIPTTVSPRTNIVGKASETIKKNNLVSINKAGLKDGIQSLGFYNCNLISRVVTGNDKSQLGLNIGQSHNIYKTAELNKDTILYLSIGQNSGSFLFYNKKTKILLQEIYTHMLCLMIQQLMVIKMLIILVRILMVIYFMTVILMLSLIYLKIMNK